MDEKIQYIIAMGKKRKTKVYKSWLTELTGVVEKSHFQTRLQFSYDKDTTEVISLINGRKMRAGHLEMPTLRSLRLRAGNAPVGQTGLKISEHVGDVIGLLRNPENKGATFQVSSQFNLLEMPNAFVTPDAGITGYQKDYTQGPRCAMECAGGLIYRNYLIPLNDLQGQTESNQIDCLQDIADEFPDERFWGMKNGYVMTNGFLMRKLTERISPFQIGHREHNRIMGSLRVGIQTDTEVVAAGPDQLVTQVFCSAIPMLDPETDDADYEAFGRLVLDGAYEATLAAAVVNAQRTGNNRVFLTYVGGGVFFNPHEWIEDAISRALRLYRNYDLDVRLVSHLKPSSIAEWVMEDYGAQ